MMNRIDVFMPPLSKYGVLHQLTKSIYESLQRLGISTRLLIAERTNPQPFLESIFSDPPQCTLSLNGLLPDKEGRFFCGLIKTPHICCLVDSPTHYLSLMQSPLNIITCPDRSACQFIKGMNFDNVLFMPHATDSTLAPDPTLERKYDVVMLASFMGIDSIRSSWKETYPKTLYEALERTVERTLSDQTTPYQEVLVMCLNEQATQPGGVDPSLLNYFTLLDEVEDYIRGKDRIELLKSIKDVNVDVFGSPGKSNGWSDLLGEDYPNITVHNPIPFEEALNVMKQSKIVLSSSPHFKQGGHERVFSGMACGAAVLCNENPFFAQSFTHGDNILFYKHNEWKTVNEQLKDVLSDDSKWQSIAQKGREVVMNHHTWDIRLSNLLEQIEPIIQSITL